MINIKNCVYIIVRMLDSYKHSILKINSVLISGIIYITMALMSFVLESTSVFTQGYIIKANQNLNGVYGCQLSRSGKYLFACRIRTVVYDAHSGDSLFTMPEGGRPYFNSDESLLYMLNHTDTCFTTYTFPSLEVVSKFKVNPGSVNFYFDDVDSAVTRYLVSRSLPDSKPINIRIPFAIDIYDIKTGRLIRTIDTNIRQNTTIFQPMYAYFTSNQDQIILSCSAVYKDGNNWSGTGLYNYANDTYVARTSQISWLRKSFDYASFYSRDSANHGHLLDLDANELYLHEVYSKQLVCFGASPDRGHTYSLHQLSPDSAIRIVDRLSGVLVKHGPIDLVGPGSFCNYNGDIITFGENAIACTASYSTKMLKQSSIIYYPNPVSTNLTLANEQFPCFANSYKIYNTSSLQLVKSGYFSASTTNKYNIDCHDIITGSYTLVLECNGQLFTIVFNKL